MTGAITYRGGPIFDGQRLLTGCAARFHDDRLIDIVPEDAAQDGEVIDLGGDVLSHGFVDLQVNGGGGLMLNDDPSLQTIRRVASAHRELGTVRLLPTLITDTPTKTAAAIAATGDAIAAGVTEVAGLHLEGPHLSVARKGAHDAALIRPMTPQDLPALLAAKRDLPVLKVTIAPENTTVAQVQAMAEAGILVSLGHTDAPFDVCVAYAKAGASCATHLFNAMSQLGNREPGLVGAALTNGGLSAGLIADGIHVHPAAMQTAWTAKQGPGHLFLVSDAMAVAGTELAEFHLGGRKIMRREGRLTLEDGTLAGADLDLVTAVRVLVEEVSIRLEDALSAATRTPAALIKMNAALLPGETRARDVIRIAKDLSGAVPLVA